MKNSPSCGDFLLKEIYHKNRDRIRLGEKNDGKKFKFINRLL